MRQELSDYRMMRAREMLVDSEHAKRLISKLPVSSIIRNCIHL